jgi:penicillin-binding protein 1A
MRYALGGSRNIPAIKAMYIAGIQNTIDLAKKMGVKSGTSCEPNCGLSSAIGDGSEIRLDEHVNGFATLARGGKYKPQSYVLKIEDVHGKKLKEWKDTAGEQVLDAQIAYIIDDMLSDSRASYFGNSYRLNNGWKSSIKTGTTNNNENGWMVGFTPKLAFGLWTGRQNDTKGMFNYTDTILGPAWNSFMKQANTTLGYNTGEGWTKPAGIKTVCINQTTGYASTSGGNCDIFPSWYTPRYPDSSKKATIDTISNKLATECTPEAAKQTITGGGIMSELPTSDSNYNNWIKPVQARYGGAGGAIPTDKDDIHTCDPADQPSIKIVSVAQSGSKVTVKYSVTQAKYPIKTVNFKIDGSIVAGGSLDGAAGDNQTFNFESTYSGEKALTAEVIDTVLYSNTDSKTFDFQTVTIRQSNPPSNTLADLTGIGSYNSSRRNKIR